MYMMKAISKLFLIWPYDSNVLKEPTHNPRTPNQALSQYKINRKKRCMYFVYDRFPCMRFIETDRDRSMVDKVNRIMSQGEEKVLKNFNIVKIVKNLRDIKHVVIHHLNKAEDGKNKEKFMK